VTIALPALRERADEIRPLAESFLREACRDNARSVRAIDDAAMNALTRWHWPGNVRELKNVVERAVVIARTDVATLDDRPQRLPAATANVEPPLPGRVPPSPAAAPAVDPSLDYKERLRLEMQRYETDLIVDALTRAGGNVTAAAQSLRIPVRTLTHKMQALGIKKRFDPA
jgi:DNA-binding NtrC family response regulator